MAQRVTRRPNGIFSVLLAMGCGMYRGGKQQDFYLVTAGSHPFKSCTRTFDLIFQGTKTGLFSEIIHPTTQLITIVLWSSHKKIHPGHLRISCEVRLLYSRSFNFTVNCYAPEAFMHWSRTSDQCERHKLIYKKSRKHFLTTNYFPLLMNSAAFPFRVKTFFLKSSLCLLQASPMGNMQAHVCRRNAYLHISELPYRFLIGFCTIHFHS